MKGQDAADEADATDEADAADATADATSDAADAADAADEANATCCTGNGGLQRRSKNNARRKQRLQVGRRHTGMIPAWEQTSQHRSVTSYSFRQR